MKKINLRKGLRRIYRVILIVAIIPTVLCGFYGITFVSEKTAYEKRDELKSADYRNLQTMAKELSMSWRSLDQYLNRDSTEKREQLEQWGFMGDTEHWPGLEVAMYTRQPLDEAIASNSCPPEISNYLKLALMHHETFDDHPSYFSFRYEDEFILSSLWASTLIVIPPLIYGLLFGLLIPFLKWIGSGFVDHTEDSKQETSNENS